MFAQENVLLAEAKEDIDTSEARHGDESGNRGNEGNTRRALPSAWMSGSGENNSSGGAVQERFLATACAEAKAEAQADPTNRLSPQGSAYTEIAVGPLLVFITYLITVTILDPHIASMYNDYAIK